MDFLAPRSVELILNLSKEVVAPQNLYGCDTGLDMLASRAGEPCREETSQHLCRNARHPEGCRVQARGVRAG